MTCDVGLRFGSVARARAARSVARARAARLVCVLCLSANQTLAQAPAPATTPAPTPATPATVSANPGVTAPAPAAAVATPEPSTLAWDLQHRRFSSWNGPSGGMLLVDPRSSEPGAVRIQLGLDAFSGRDYLLKNDKIEVSGQTLAVSVTAHENVELFASLANRTTNQTKGGNQSLDAIGDVAVGAKFFGALSNVLGVGADLRATFFNGVGGGGFDWGATNFGLRSSLSIDLQGLEKPVPFITRLNAGYIFDNSALLVEDTENQRYKRYNATPKEDETLHLINRFERLAMGINRFDRFAFGLGFEVPLELAKQFYMHPLAELQLGVPVNRQSYDCPYVVANSAKAGTIDSADDSCYERSPGSLPMNLGLGVRVVPPVRGLSVLVGVDLGLTGSSKFVRELTPNLPWRLMLAISYDYDARPAAHAVVLEPTAVGASPATVATVVAATPTGRVQGLVAAPDNTPIADARVRFIDRTLSLLATGNDGRFSSEPLPPGQVAIEASHPDYETGQCSAVIATQGGDSDVRCTLTPKPLVGKIQGQVLDAWGGTVSGARLILTGPANQFVLSDAHGGFEIPNLTAGAYVLRIEAGGYFTRQVQAQVQARSTNLVNPSLTRKPIAPSIRQVGDGIEAPGIKFNGEATQLDAAGLSAVAEIADLLLTRTDLYLQIQGYGSNAVAMARAIGIKQRLLEAGVPETHVEAVGGGKAKMTFTLHH